MEKKAHRFNREFYDGKSIFVTGHTGFKGSWLTALLHYLHADTTGYALEPPDRGLFNAIDGSSLLTSVIGDVTDFSHLAMSVADAEPEIVFHLAAMAIVNDCYENPQGAYATNVMGTVNLLESVRHCPSVKSVVIVTTDKVYENKGDGAVYKETDKLGGVDPYSSSKTCMEYIVEAYKRSYLQRDNRKVGISTVRASNVLGGGDHIKSRLIPSILQSIAEGKPVELRHPHQTRPWQSVLDALNGYLSIGRLMYENPLVYSGQWNIGPTIDGIREVSWVVEQMRRHYGSASYVIGEMLAPTESETLGLDIAHSLQELDWEPRLSCDKMIYNVVDFFKRQKEGIKEIDICMSQIDDFFNDAKESAV